MLKRKLLRALVTDLRNNPAVAILGPRQVGKTTLARTLQKQLKKQVVYLDLEKQSDIRKLGEPEIFFDLYKNHCVILDEVQRMPELFSALRPAIDEYRKNGRFILLGSASPQLVRGVSESLAGRIVYRELAPIGLTELPASIPISKHWLRGGYPKALLAKNNTVADDWMDGFVRSYVERDLSAMFGMSISTTVMRNFLSMLSHSNSGIWNAQNFARSLGISSPTASRYLDFLEASFLVRKLPAWFVNAKKRLVKSPKVYLRDSGMLHHITGITDLAQLHGNLIAGSSWEGYVVEEICKQLPGDVQAFYYRTQAGAECDLVLVKNLKVLACIEIKLSLSPTLSRGFFEACEDLQPNKKIILTAGFENFRLENGVKALSLGTFIGVEMKHILK
jgi:predicted AAA+ superfamily ATPase